MGIHRMFRWTSYSDRGEANQIIPDVVITWRENQRWKRALQVSETPKFRCIQCLKVGWIERKVAHPKYTAHPSIQLLHWKKSRWLNGWRLGMKWVNDWMKKSRSIRTNMNGLTFLFCCEKRRILGWLWNFGSVPKVSEMKVPRSIHWILITFPMKIENVDGETLILRQTHSFCCWLLITLR